MGRDSASQTISISTHNSLVIQQSNEGMAVDSHPCPTPRDKVHFD